MLVENDYIYDQDKLSKIRHNGVEYSFGYNGLGYNTSVSVGAVGATPSATLVSYNYNHSNGNLEKLTYGNGDYMTYSYDGLDRVASIGVNGSNRYNFYYNNLGEVGKVEDQVNDLITSYIYDTNGRVTHVNNSDGYSRFYSYDDSGSVETTNTITDDFGPNEISFRNSYKANNQMGQSVKDESVFKNTNEKISKGYSYDLLNRLDSKTFEFNSSAIFKENYIYEKVTGQTNRTTNFVSKIQYRKGDDTLISDIKYEYNDNGNIKKIVDSNGQTEYYYDELNQLVRETHYKNPNKS